MTDIRLKLVVSPGGARGDFVAGWTGLLPNCLDNWWTINPITGKSAGFFRTKLLDRNETLHSILADINLCLDPSSELFWTSTCHGHLLTTDAIDQMLDTGAVEIYVIDHRNVPRSTLIWEFIVKTYLTHCNTVEFENTGRSWAIDQDAKLTTRQMINGQVTNAHRIKAIKNVINLHKQLVVDNNNDRFLKNPRVTALDYNCLFRAGGSYYLCEKFNLTAEVRLHEYWDHMLSVIKSPDSIDALGYTWRKTDFFN